MQPQTDETISSWMATGRLQICQTYRLLQYVHANDKLQIEKMTDGGVDNLINLTEPQDGTGGLHVAVTANNQDLVSFLLSKGAHPNIQDRRGRTPVMLAAELGNDSILEMLAEHNADIRLRDTEGKGLLFYCIHPTKQHFRCLQVALKFEADVNNECSEGTHVFQLMCGKALECACLMLLEEGANPNAANQRTGMTALMSAASKGSQQLVRAILKKGANPDAVDQWRSSAAHYAAMGGFLEVIQVLSAYSADIGRTNIEACSPLHYAAASGNPNCCKFLAQRGCVAKLKNQRGLLPRQIAKDWGHKAAAKELKKAERMQKKGNKPTSGKQMTDVWALNLHDWSQEHQSELLEAFGSDSEKVPAEQFISVLLELNVPVDVDQINQVIAAHSVDKQPHVNISEFIKGAKYIKKPFLCSAYLPKKKKGKKGKKGRKKGKRKGKFALPLPICRVPPHLMTRRMNGGPPQFMIEAHNNRLDISRFRDHPTAHPIINDSEWYQEKPERAYVDFNYCVTSGELDHLDQAFSHGVPVDVQDPFYKTPLMVACYSGNYKVAQYLLSHGADVNMSGQYFWTPLHYAAQAGHGKLVELLLEAGADVDARAMCGGTPLMRAIQGSQPTCVDILLKAGANVKAENKKGHTCLDIADAFADLRVLTLIKDKLATLPKVDSKNKTARKPPKAKPAPGKVIAPADTSSATVEMVSPQKETNSIILHNSSITTGKTKTVDITFSTKTVWGKPTTIQQLSKLETKGKQNFDDLMSRSAELRPLEETKDQT